ncbi:MAG: hypothetical protein JNK89_01260 [Saprospiraceae bacterium]|nr:hypothetical protein [Saprospiraceae bacterium]
MHDIWQWFSAASKYGMGLSLLLLALRFRRLPGPFRLLVLILLNDLLTEFLSTWLFRQKINNMPLLHGYTLASFWLYSFFFRDLFRKKMLVRRYFWWFVAIVSLLLIANTLWLEPIDGFNSKAKTLVQLFFIAYAVYYLFDAFGKTDLLQASALATILVVMAVLIYNAGSLFIFMFAQIITDGRLSYEAQSGLWMINSLLYFVFQLVLLLAVWIQVFKVKK